MADSPGYTVTTDTLHREAGIWDQQAEQLTAIVAKVYAVKMDRLQAGLFQLVVDAYGEVVNSVEGRATEGQQVMHNIAAALRKVAANYEAQEQQHNAMLRNMIH